MTVSDGDTVRASARFVFQGTVMQTRAATMPSVPVSDATYVVRVDDLIVASDYLLQTAGQNITVLSRKAEPLQVNERATFYTEGWIFGESVAVLALDYEPITAEEAAVTSPGTGPQQNLEERDLRDRLQSARYVVVGRVSSVQPAESEPGPISEHNPEWHEATVDIESVEAGELAGVPTVTVSFPTSTDVAWYRAPRFKEGDEGVWALHERETPARTRLTALHPLDYQPRDRVETVRALLQGRS